VSDHCEACKSRDALDFANTQQVGKQIRVPDLSGASPVRINVNATPSDYGHPENQYRALFVAELIARLLREAGK
jgi:hypothetical protein